MGTKRAILITALSLMILAVFIFRQSILKLSNMQLLLTFIIAFVVLLVVTHYAVKHGLKERKLEKQNKSNFYQGFAF